MGVGYVTNEPKGDVIFPYKLSGEGYAALTRLSAFYKEEPSVIIDRLLKEKSATLFSGSLIP